MLINQNSSKQIHRFIRKNSIFFGDKLRSWRYKKHHAADSLVYHRSGWHVRCEYTFKGPYNSLEFYMLKNFHWWYSVNRRIKNENDKLHKIRCAEKYCLNYDD